MDAAGSVREFWFGRTPLSAAALAERMRFWFGAEGDELTRQRDAQIRERFGALLERAAAGALAAWADSPRRRLSLIILLDQFPRNVFRGSARAFACDSQALTLALSGMQSGADAALEVAERLFFYMPLQHAENSEVQDESLAAYRRLLAEAPPELQPALGGALQFAAQHHAIIERFGRFPHRNQVLGRASTRAEEDWLLENDAGFGQ